MYSDFITVLCKNEIKSNLVRVSQNVLIFMTSRRKVHLFLLATCLFEMYSFKVALDNLKIYTWLRLTSNAW